MGQPPKVEERYVKTEISSRGAASAYSIQIKTSGTNMESSGKRTGSTASDHIFRSDVLDIRLDSGEDFLIVTLYKKLGYGLEKQPDRIYERVDHAEYSRLVNNRNWKQLYGQSIRKKGAYFKVYNLYDPERKFIAYFKVEEIFPRGIIKADIVTKIYKRCNYEI